MSAAGFRIGFSALWDVLLDVVAVAGEHERQALADVATTFWCLIDRFLEAVSNAYRDATAELGTRAAAPPRRSPGCRVLWWRCHRQHSVGHHPAPLSPA
jgi:hypothetical protein